MLLSKYAIYGRQKPRFIKEQEVEGILNSLVLKRPSFGDILF